MEKSTHIGPTTTVPLPWVIAAATLVFAVFPSLLTLKLVDERTKDLPKILQDHETRIVVLEVKGGSRTDTPSPVAVIPDHQPPIVKPEDPPTEAPRPPEAPTEPPPEPEEPEPPISVPPAVLPEGTLGGIVSSVKKRLIP